MRNQTDTDLQLPTRSWWVTLIVCGAFFVATRTIELVQGGSITVGSVRLSWIVMLVAIAIPSAKMYRDAARMQTIMESPGYQPPATVERHSKTEVIWKLSYLVVLVIVALVWRIVPSPGTHTLFVIVFGVWMTTDGATTLLKRRSSRMSWSIVWNIVCILAGIVLLGEGLLG